MVEYHCSNCGYRLQSEKVVKRCPYCDKTNISKEKSADELLSSLEEN